MPIGTRVRLASGGPVMVIVDNAKLADGLVTCAWEGGEDEFRLVVLDVVRSIHHLHR